MGAARVCAIAIREIMQSDRGKIVVRGQRSVQTSALPDHDSPLLALDGKGQDLTH
jgi:hypothetical protein